MLCVCVVCVYVIYPHSVISTVVFESDRVYGTSRNARSERETETEMLSVFLYGHLGDTQLLELHRQLVVEHEQQPFQYYFRHYYANADDADHAFEPVTLQGWGVDLTLKSVEYKVMDHANPHSDGTYPLYSLYSILFYSILLAHTHSIP